MPYQYGCSDCQKVFKTVKGKHWHEKRYGHAVGRLPHKFPPRLTRVEAEDLLRQEANAPGFMWVFPNKSLSGRQGWQP